MIDRDNKNNGGPENRGAQDYMMVLNAEEYSSEEIVPNLGRVIWVLNRMIEKSAKGKRKQKKK